MMQHLTLNPIKYVNGKISIPGSKSISNRVLILAAQSLGNTILNNLPICQDVYYMLIALKRLGIKYKIFNYGRSCYIYGNNGPIFNKKVKIFTGCSGTATRFLIASLCLKQNNIKISVDYRMKKRPILDLVLALKQGGALLKYKKCKDYIISLYGGYNGGKIFIKGNISSQFITSLLMMAPQAKGDSIIYILEDIVSKSYIKMTIALMKLFGIKVKHENYRIFYINGQQKYKSPVFYNIESDISNASYFLAAAAIKGKSVSIYGVNKKSIQGDIKFLHILKKIGARIKFGVNYIKCSRGSAIKPIIINMNDMPDTAMTLAIISLFSKKGKTLIYNISNWRFKETNRLNAFFKELSKLGFSVRIGKNFIEIRSLEKLNTPVIINTYNDHRMAMCFSLLALLNVQVTIVNPQCVKKTFPNFFKKLSHISIL